MSAHSPFGPSSAHRWKPCPGSIILCAGIPDTTSAAAIEGSAAHCVAKHLHTGEEVIVGLPVEPGMIYHPARDVIHLDGGADYHGSVVITEEMIEYAQAYVDYCRLIPAEQTFVETRVDFSEYVPMGFGTSDFIAICGDTIDTVDLKYGVGKQVWAGGNGKDQGLLYTLGAYIRAGKPHHIKKARVHIHQPRLDHIDVAEFTIEEVLAYGEAAGESARLAIAAQEDPFMDITPLLNPGSEQCFWCPAKATCPARAEFGLRTAMQEFSTVPDALDTLLIDGELPLRKPALLTPADLALLLPAVDAVAKWCKDVMAAAMRAFVESKGDALPGYKLVGGRSNTVWKDDGAAADTLILEYGLAEEVVLPPRLVSPAVAKKLVGKKAAGQLEPLITKPPGTPKLVPATDPRPAINVMDGSEFASNDADES